MCFCFCFNRLYILIVLSLFNHCMLGVCAETSKELYLWGSICVQIDADPASGLRSWCYNTMRLLGIPGWQAAKEKRESALPEADYTWLYKKGHKFLAVPLSRKLCLFLYLLNVDLAMRLTLTKRTVEITMQTEAWRAEHTGACPLLLLGTPKPSCGGSG